MASSSPPSPTLEIPIEIVSEEEMGLIEAAFVAARSYLSSTSSSLFSPSRLHENARSIRSITTLSKRKLSVCSETGSLLGDIEDSLSLSFSASGADFRNTHNKNTLTHSLLHRFRRKRGLSVTDITGTEWCEKQKEFFLHFGKPKATRAMKAGSARHAALQEEVVKRVKLRIESDEDLWAIKLINFIVGANQLLFDGLTRELPLIGFAEGVWMVGVIDEIRMPLTETVKNPTLVETKTRAQATIPSEPQRRNGKLQLMCYKLLWESLVADKFPSRKFFDFFSLNPNYMLSEEIRENTVKSGFPAQTLDELVRYYQNTCSMLPPAHDQLLLRYEFQENQSLRAEDEFSYDPVWVKDQIKCCLEFWRGEREASYAPEEERWKCKFCNYSSICPINAKPEESTQS